jgi:hypothetical protein
MSVEIEIPNDVDLWSSKSKRVPQSSIISLAIREDIGDWCKENEVMFFIPLWNENEKARIEFRDEHKAVLFKLRWF